MSWSRLIASIVLALLCAACRSDGGFDRADRARGFEFAAGSVAARTVEDVHSTGATLASIPGSILASFVDGWSAMKDTYHLYLEGRGSQGR